jgi:hypothetical protein
MESKEGRGGMQRQRGRKYECRHPETTYLSDFSIPEMALDQSMSKYHRESMSKLETGMIIEEVTTTLMEIIDKMLHDKIYNEIMTLIGEVLSIREEVTTFSKEESAKQEKINS